MGQRRESIHYGRNEFRIDGVPFRAETLFLEIPVEAAGIV